MFDRIRKAFSRGDASAKPQARPAPRSVVTEWAASQGFASTMSASGQAVTVEGKLRDRPWRMELGKPTRDYIRGEELRARAELRLSDELALMVMNRPLKEALDKRAYSMFTDTLRTTADASLPEEMRWLAMYDEVGWEHAPPIFWERYAVVADRREHAQAWVDAPLVEQLLNWPLAGPGADIPFMLLILRGRAYLRMEYAPAQISTLQHAATVFTTACESALDGLRDLPKRE